jgi:hypothetical protein
MLLVFLTSFATPFHVARSTRWPCLQFGYSTCWSGSNTFAGALILRNCSATSHTGQPCCGDASVDILDGNCHTSPEKVRDALSSVPRGQRLLGMLDGKSDPALYANLRDQTEWDPLPDGFFGPWAERAAHQSQQRWGAWLGAFAAAGGEVDVFHVDAEFSGWAVTGDAKSSFAAQRSITTNATGVGAALLRDPRWPALRARLEAAGAPFGANFSNASVASMGGWAADARDMRAHVWNAVMYVRMAEALNASFTVPALAAFPGAALSSYSHSYRPPETHWTYMTGTSEHHPPFAGPGAHVGTHQSKSIYPQGDLRPGCAVVPGIRSRMGECWTFGTPFWERKFVPYPVEFGALMWAVTRARGLAVASGVPAMPWIEPKASALYPPGGSLLKQSELYQVLCYAMLCYAMLRYAMLCYAMLRYATLRYAML